MDRIYFFAMVCMAVSALFFNGPEQKADIETKQQRYEKASSFLQEFGYSETEIDRILKQN